MAGVRYLVDRRNADRRRLGGSLASSLIATPGWDPLASLGGAAEPTRNPPKDRGLARRRPIHLGNESNGASRTRTGDLLGAIQALSQLSYSPARRPL